MSAEVYILIVCIHLLAIIMILGLVKILPTTFAVPTPPKKIIVLGVFAGFALGWFVLFPIRYFTIRYPPISFNQNNVVEGIIQYIGSGRTPMDTGSLIVVYQNNGSVKALECYGAKEKWLKYNAIPCGNDEIAYRELNRKFGKVWFYNDLLPTNSPNSYVRDKAVQIVLQHKIYPYDIQAQVIKESLNSKTHDPFHEDNIIAALGFLIFTLTGFILILKNKHIDFHKEEIDSNIAKMWEEYNKKHQNT
ncbi:hypothetical protein E0765_01815 [Sulfuricurvum sp. IAE1]|uniref:hypothetical protein n=1 Tax=Sulfuricurvum sp. IAE1 TaxID=2546102 RepID=UPI001051AAC6|nr:hypothetical protein [Sulfuricurvum sp. IAE1]TDA69177.1 hypothetical protein E0765_01815 [Sulfuricurvum sp. IAE1]